MIQFHCTDQANTSRGSYIYILIKIDFYHEKKKKYRNTINEYKKSMFWYARNIIVLNTHKLYHKSWERLEFCLEHLTVRANNKR